MSDTTETPEENIETQAAEETVVDAPQDDDPQARIAELEAENAAMKDQLVRTLADMDNLRKRTAKETADARVYAIERFAGDLLPVSDNMSRALDVLSEDARAELSEPGKKLLEGVEMTQKELHAALARNGVTSIDAAPGAVFDPNLHQAVSQIPSSEPSGSVAATFQSGWKIGERILRAAMVAVSSGTPAAPQESESAES